MSDTDKSGGEIAIEGLTIVFAMNRAHQFCFHKKNDVFADICSLVCHTLQITQHHQHPY